MGGSHSNQTVVLLRSGRQPPCSSLAPTSSGVCPVRMPTRRSLRLATGSGHVSSASRTARPASGRAGSIWQRARVAAHPTMEVGGRRRQGADPPVGQQARPRMGPLALPRGRRSTQTNLRKTGGGSPQAVAQRGDVTTDRTETSAEARTSRSRSRPRWENRLQFSSVWQRL